MAIPYLFRSPLCVFFLGLAAAACSSSPRSAPDAPPDLNPATDASIVTSSDGAGLDAWGEAGSGGRVTISPTSIDLGMILHDVRSSPQIITVTATGDVSDLIVLLVGEHLAIDGGGTCSRTLAAGTSCVVAFTFLSSTIGANSDRVTIVADGQSTIVPVTAQVQAGPKLVVTPAMASFLAAPGESSSPVTFKVWNIGDMEVGPLTVEITGDDAADFAALPTGCDLLVPMGTCTISVVFTPKVGARLPETAALVVTGPAPDFSTATAALCGNCGSGGPATLSLTSPTPDLGSVVVGTTGPSVTVTVTSSSAASQGPLTVTSSSAEFVITNDTCGATVLSLGGACTLDVALRPSSAGSKNALLTVAASSGAVSMMFIGTGLDSSTDASIVTPPDDAGLDHGNVDPIDSPGLDASSESQGEAGPAG